MDFFQAIQLCIDKNLQFAAYRLPHHDAVRLIVQNDSTVMPTEVNAGLFERKGFLLAPFKLDEAGNSLFVNADFDYISADYTDFNELELLQPVPLQQADFSNGVVARKDFMSQVENIKSQISEGRFEKVVLSRIKVIERSYRHRLTEIFQMLTTSYSNAFVYLVNAGAQLWLGATPEPLMCSNKNELSTVSLAGTRRYNAENLNLHNWCKKERVEQELVTSYIQKALNKFQITNYSKVGPYTKKAGNLVHLRTDFTLDFHVVNGQIGNLLSELHPTSAVCGIPKEEAMSYLLRTEKHNRRYYSGYLGPVNIEERMLLFVNLRCMEILPDRLVLYVGAGITSESVAADEWDETEIKADTLLSVIHKV
ncbi:MAG: chorismate-binding protein [Prolixibacteraceae bacterium]|jgi:isochorismate synthase|nr:chorismate-binding protein [Prolixibacteraceae bacterium]